MSAGADNRFSRILWFHDSASVDAFLASPVKGVTAIQISGYLPNKQAQSDKARRLGLSIVSGITGSPGLYGRTYATSIAYLEHTVIDPAIAQKADMLYVDEPWGQALNDPRECGPGCYVAGHGLSPTAVAWIVKTYNTLFLYLKAARPGALTGICESSQEFHEKTLAGGLKADFVCMESYGASTPKHLLSIQKDYSQVKTMMLIYGSFPLCQQLAWGADKVNMLSFWDVDNFPHWIAGGGAPHVGPNEIDPNWMSRIRQFVSGDRSFCPTLLNQPRSDPYGRR
jgi:hypothetical protein